MNDTIARVSLASPFDSMVVIGDKAYVAMDAAQTMVGNAVRAHAAVHAKAFSELQTQRVKDLEAESQRGLEYRAKWKDAEQRCGRLDRAEEALRSYETMIADLRKDNERLTEENARLARQGEANTRRLRKAKAAKKESQPSIEEF